MLKELKKLLSTELKKSRRTMSRQRENINKNSNFHYLQSKNKGWKVITSKMYYFIINNEKYLFSVKMI